MKFTRIQLLSTLAVLMLAVVLYSSPLLKASSAQSKQQLIENKISSWVIEHTANDQEAEFLVILADRADLSAAESIETKVEKSRFVREALWNRAQSSQSSLRDWLRARRIEHRAFYIVNAILVKANSDVMLTIAARDEVLRIEGNPHIQNTAPTRPLAVEQSDSADSIESVSAIEAGLNYVRAPEVWSLGFTGQNIVIASADTGVDWEHPALKPHYRGWNGTTANHDYNWHDSIHTNGGVCGADAKVPCDDNNHGTHTTGTALGDDGGDNKIGMAPGAKFIGCRNMDRGDGTPARYIECMEFFLAPYPVNGTPAQGDSTKAPDISINSWGCPPSEGCQPLTLQQAIEAQRAAGIMTVVAAGNAGPSCSTVNDPPGVYDASYSVGAFNATTGDIAGFSSRGPVTADGSNRQKPDITAPGVGVRSSLRGGGYGSFNGTSMATPHVAGAIALLWSAVPALRRQIDLTEALLNESAVRVNTSTCGNATPPNNTYGFGRLDIKAAVDLARARNAVTVSAASYQNSEMASNSIVAAFGANLASSTQGAMSTPLPTSLGGISVKVRDSAGIERMSPLFFASPTQINYQIPGGSANGLASVIITRGDQASTGSIMISNVAPGLFSADSSGSGVAAAFIQRYRNNQLIAEEPVADFDGSKFVLRAIDLSRTDEQVFLILFGTGIRNVTSLADVSLQIGGTPATVIFAGAQPSFVGLDQLNVLLPASLTGRDEANVALTVSGKQANPLKIGIR